MAMLKLFCCVFVLLSHLVHSDDVSPSRHRLLTELLEGYDKINAPLVLPPSPPGGGSFAVMFGTSLVRAELDRASGVLTANIWLQHSWTDRRLVWDPLGYSDIRWIHIPSQRLWKPDIVLYNSIEKPEMISNSFNAIVYANGTVIWIPPVQFRVDCLKDGNDFICPFKFGSWTYDGYAMGLQFFGDAYMYTNDLIPNSRDLYVESYIPATLNEKFYPCCSEPYPDITYQVTVRPS